MANPGLVTKNRYEVLLHDIDLDLMIRRRQVPVSGTSMYLKLIEPNPMNWQKKGPLKPSTVVFQQLKIKRKIIIHLNMDAYLSLKDGKEVRIRAFYIRKES